MRRTILAFSCLLLLALVLLTNVGAGESPVPPAVSPQTTHLATISPGPDRVEVLDKRTRTSKHFRNPGGSFTAELHAGSVHYQDPQGRWQDIDNTLVPTSVSGFAYQNTANQFTTLFGASTSGKIMELKSGDKSVILSAVGAVTVPAVATGNAVKYGGGLGNAVDLSLLSSYDGAELLITLNQPGVSGAAFELDLDGLTVEPTASGHVLLKDTASGAVWGRINRAFAIDANGEFTADVSYSISQQAGKFRWRIAASPAWLGDPERTYPVVIDPWMSLQGEGTGEHGLQDIMLNANYPDTNYEGWYLYVGPGAVDHPFRSLVQFDISSLGACPSNRFRGIIWAKLVEGGSLEQSVSPLRAGADVADASGVA